MKQNSALLFRNSVFKWIALATVAGLMIPLIAMQVSAEVAWDLRDFVVMGSLLFGLSSLFVLTARKLPGRYRVFVGAVFIAAFLAIWAELAVGVFTNLGR